MDQRTIVIIVVAYAILNASVQALEAPSATDGKGYRYLYRFSHLVCFNFQYALKAKFPAYIPEQQGESK